MLDRDILGAISLKVCLLFSPIFYILEEFVNEVRQKSKNIQKTDKTELFIGVIIIYLGNLRKPLKSFVKTNGSLIRWY